MTLPEHCPKQNRLMSNGSPYSLRESLLWIWKFFFIAKNNPEHVEFLSKKCCLNNINPKTRIGVIGDIMDLCGNHLETAPELNDFFQDCDFLIGNFEATITDAKKEFHGDQIHDDKILDGLKSLYDPQKTYLSLANNHAGDFPLNIFESSVKALKSAGFQIFGFFDPPFIDLLPELRIIGATNWSNKLRGFDYIANIEHISTRYIKPDAMNILFPHWGYEMELFPRTDIVYQGKELLKHYDIILGSHSHLPQPISAETTDSGLKKLIAYSLGNFSFGLRGALLKKFYFGEILKFDIGKTDRDEWAVGNIEWSFIRTRVPRAGIRRVEPIDSIPYFNSLS